jgi:N-dimethylarginine dimethylaminohydrolase
MKRILVCDPEFFDIQYEINSWMSVHNSADKPKARRQWENMLSCLVKGGAKLEHIAPDPDFPDMVFTANAGLVRGNKVVLSNNRHVERQGEKPIFKKWFLDHGYDVVELPDGIRFEGAGDAIWFNNILFMGHGFRTDKEAHPLVAKALGVDYVSCELIDPYFYHIDTCLFATENQFVYYPAAFGQMSLFEMIKKVGYHIINTDSRVIIHPVDDHQASHFVCNSVKLDHSIVTPTHDPDDIFPTSNIFHCDMSEFIKAGGAVKCLTLEL